MMQMSPAPWTRLRRALVAIGALAVLYGIAAQIGQKWLPHRIWMDVHYIDDVELLPTYRSLGEELVFLLQSGILPSSIAVSTGRILIGFFLGACAGILLGVATGRSRRIEDLAEPWVTFLRFTPALALLPLYVVWFGYGEPSKVLLIATNVAVVTLLGAHQGVRGVPRVYLDSAASLGAGSWLRFRKVVLPAAFPSIFASVRIPAGLALVVLSIAQFIPPKLPHFCLPFLILH